jgi:hypothetical protein
MSGLNMSEARATPGAASLSISSHFPTIWKSTNVNNVSAWMRQARNEALLDGIVDRRHNDRNGACRLPQRPDDRRCLADDYVGRERH